MLVLCTVGILAQSREEKKARADAILKKATAQMREETRASRTAVIEALPEARRLYQDLGDKKKYIEALAMTGAAYQKLGEYRKALDVFYEGLKLLPPDDDYERIAVFKFIGTNHLELGEREKALEFLNKAVEVSEKISYRLHKAEALIVLGDAYASFADIDQAFSRYDQAAGILEGIGRDDMRADLLTKTGITLANAGYLDRAFKNYEVALELMDKQKNERGRGLVLNNRGSAHLSANSKQVAIADFEAALKIFEGGGENDKNLQALALTNLSQALAGIGERDKGLKMAKRALDLALEKSDRPLEAFARNNLGVLMASLGEHAQALAEFKLVERIRKDLDDRQGEVGLFNNIGLMHMFLGENEKAAEYFNAALAVPGNPSQVLTYNNLGTLQARTKDFAKAIKFADMALDAHKKTGELALYPTTLNNKAVATYRLGKNAEATELFDQAVVAYRSGNDRHGEAIAFGNLMYLWRDLGSRGLAIFYGKMSVNQLQTLRADIRSIEGDIQQSFLGTVDNVYRQLIELLVADGRVAEAEQVLRMLKDEEYFSFVGRDGAEIPSLDQRLELSTAEMTAEQQLNGVKPKAGILADEDLAALKTVSSRRLAILKAKPAGLPLSDQPAGGSRSAVRDWKDPNTVMVSTVVAPNSLILIVTSAKSRRAFTVAVSEEVLSRKVGQFRKAITDRGDTRPVSQELYDLIVGPIKPQLKALWAKTIVWSLDKFLRYLPIPALKDEKSGYVAQEFATVIMAQAGRQDLAISPKGKSQWRVLAAGVSQGTADLEALPFVPSELCSIAREPSQECEGRRGVIPGTRMLNARFTYASFTQAVPNYRVAHIATHFKFISGTKAEGLGSYLLLGNGEKLTMDKVRRSNGLFAGIELLTLSACDTAYGSKTADGREIEGFGVLAQKQGARSIMATLWRGDDESTRDLMVAFYSRYRQAGMTKSEALRQAQVDMIGVSRNGSKTPFGGAKAAKFSHPYFWAPFILIGNWR